MDQLLNFYNTHPVLAASLSSVWGAVLVDLISFSRTKDPGPWVEQFSFKAAGLKYLQSFVGGLVGNVAVATTVSVVSLGVIWLW